MDSVQAEKEQNFVRWESAVSGRVHLRLHVLVRQQSAGYTLGSSLKSPAEGEGNEVFPPPPEKDLESPSSTRLEALDHSRDLRAMTRSPSPRAWRPDFPGAAREAP